MHVQESKNQIVARLILCECHVNQHILAPLFSPRLFCFVLLCISFSPFSPPVEVFHLQQIGPFQPK